VVAPRLGLRVSNVADIVEVLLRPKKTTPPPRLAAALRLWLARRGRRRVFHGFFSMFFAIENYISFVSFHIFLSLFCFGDLCGFYPWPHEGVHGAEGARVRRGVEASHQTNDICHQIGSKPARGGF
jgi:hypothetical protein